MVRGRPQPPTGARSAATPIFGPILAQLCQITTTCSMHKPQVLGALLTASGLLNLYTNFYPNWTKNLMPTFGISTKFDRFQPIN